jgi:outer membrane protein OmpA-like peptidoglycan-associated protein
MPVPQNKYSLFQKSFLSILLIFVVSITNAQNIKFSFLFDSGKDRVALWEARDFFKLIKGIKADSISIQGHCDSVGSDAYNLKLSMQRVQAVKSMLLHNGIKAKQIK